MQEQPGTNDPQMPNDGNEGDSGERDDQEGDQNAGQGQMGQTPPATPSGGTNPSTE